MGTLCGSMHTKFVTSIWTQTVFGGFQFSQALDEAIVHNMKTTEVFGQKFLSKLLNSFSDLLMLHPFVVMCTAIPA